MLCVYMCLYLCLYLLVAQTLAAQDATRKRGSRGGGGAHTNVRCESTSLQAEPFWCESTVPTLSHAQGAWLKALWRRKYIYTIRPPST
jgi:hypothetical protein